MVDNIKKLTDLQHCRIRTEMYFGSRSVHTQKVLIHTEDGPEVKELSWVPALLTAFREILDNSLDEVVGKGQGNTVRVNFNPEKFEFTVQDNGAGIPINWDDDHGMHTATMVMTETKAGRNFDDDDRKGVAGLNGLGASVTVMTSEYTELEVVRDGQKFKQKYTEPPKGFSDLIIYDPVIRESSSATGTKVTFKPSRDVFKNLVLPEEFIKSRLLEIAIANPYLKLYYNNTRIKIKNNFEKTLFSKFKPIKIEVDQKGFKAQYLLIPNVVEDGDHHHSVVNNVPTIDGGIHVDEFRSTFYYHLVKALEKEGKKRRLKPNRSDVQQGLLLFNYTVMDAPYFANQAKTQLINDEVKPYIKSVLTDESLYKNIIKKNREWIDEIFQRCAERTQRKDENELERESKRNLRKKIPKLTDANNRDRKHCILALAEGDSAVSGAANVRNPKIHALLPLRGKILNAYDVQPKRILESQSTSDIMNAVGLIIGKKANREDLRYGQLWIMTDADVDGGNIQCLIVNFLYKFWPELFDPEDPFVYAFMTPYIIAEKGKESKYWYADNYHEFKPDEWKGWTITRCKGLGTLQKADWKYSFQNPKLIPLVYDNKLQKMLDLVFDGTRADDRKLWMSGEMYV